MILCCHHGKISRPGDASLACNGQHQHTYCELLFALIRFRSKLDLAVYFLAMTDSDNEHDQDVILDSINHAVVSCSDSVEVVFSGELLASSGFENSME